MRLIAHCWRANRERASSESDTVSLNQAGKVRNSTAEIDDDDEVDVLFDEHCGADRVIDAYELKIVLSKLLASSLGTTEFRWEEGEKKFWFLRLLNR